MKGEPPTEACREYGKRSHAPLEWQSSSPNSGSGTSGDHECRLVQPVLGRGYTMSIVTVVVAVAGGLLGVGSRCSSS